MTSSVPATSGNGAATTTAASASGSGSGMTVDYQSFLKLLTAQLRNQDPLSPMDATQFMTQLAQLSSVEQAVKTNDTLTEVKDMLHSAGMRMDMTYLGRNVQALTDQFGLAAGKAEIAYLVDGTPASVKLEVIDSTGKTVRTTSGSLASGRQTFQWDGVTDGGTPAPDGTYQVKITAKDKDGNKLDAATLVSDTVKEVRTVNGVSYFVLQGGATVQVTDIIAAS
jgi:flagellar basal-body rod modification protein FlgD